MITGCFFVFIFKYLKMENERPEYLYCFIKWFKWANFHWRNYAV